VNRTVIRKADIEKARKHSPCFIGYEAGVFFFSMITIPLGYLYLEGARLKLSIVARN